MIDREPMEDRIAELERLNQGLEAQVHDLTQSLGAAESRVKELKYALELVLKNNGDEEIKRLEADNITLRVRIGTLEEELRKLIHHPNWESVSGFSGRIRDALKVSADFPLDDLANRVECLATENSDLRARPEHSKSINAHLGERLERYENTGSAITPRIYLAGQALAGLLGNTDITLPIEVGCAQAVALADVVLGKLECPT